MINETKSNESCDFRSVGSAGEMLNQIAKQIASIEMNRAEYLAQPIGYPDRKRNLRETARALRELRAMQEKYS